MYKFRIVVRYEDEETYQDLVQLARDFQLSFAHVAERGEFILFINEVTVLVDVAMRIHDTIE